MDWNDTECVSIFLVSAVLTTFLQLTVNRTKENLWSGKMLVCGDQWPIFLYAHHTFDTEDPWCGLLRSRLLVCVSRRIYFFKVFRYWVFFISGLQAHFYFPKFCRQRAKSYTIWKCSPSWDEFCHHCIHSLHCNSGPLMCILLLSGSDICTTEGPVCLKLLLGILMDRYNNRLWNILP